MKRFGKGPAWVAGLVLAACALGAQATPVDESHPIATELQRLLQVPGKTLHLHAVAVASPYALAGWTNGDKGGRVLLRMQDSKWSVVVLAGTELLRPEVLHAMGVAPGDAEDMLRRARLTDRQLNATERSLMDSFPGMVKPLPAKAITAQRAAEVLNG